MNIDSILKPFQRFGVHLGLKRMEKLLANLGNPHHQVPIIHVAGTNGKGSVCAYLSSVLTQAGYRTGRYTSPHLVDWTERICLNEQPISADELCQFLLKVQAKILPEEDSPTQFEVLTAAAWLYFAEVKADIAVIEVGLGGRLDATNVCENPLVTIITSIALEHTQVLGPTVAHIAVEKAGILKPGCPVVLGSLPPDAEEVVRSRVLELKCSCVIPQRARQIAPGWAEYQEARGVEEKQPATNNPQCENLKSIKYSLPLQGQFQLTNSALAIATVEILQKQGWQISEADIVNGIAKTKWLGRIQWVTWNKHKLLLDGAHNSAAAQVLRDYVDSLDGMGSAKPIPNLKSEIGVTWVMGSLSTKDHADIFKALLRSNDQLYLVPIPDHSSANLGELATLAQHICPELSFCGTYVDLVSGLNAAFTSTNRLVVLCGSLYLVGNFLQILTIPD
ncbi:MAG: bifunctional folylpolyglutamate synthase/dihydrofolate synthase [Rhizonema sp. PD38]|nr:bifunctional folylpolyglutamate synthase/dihydrofolate synthase [Rhizonema sp. PD38]